MSIMSFNSVRKALLRLSHKVTPIDIKHDFLNKIKGENFDLAFIALHGKHGEDGCVQGMLEMMQIPYTHSGVLACILCMNKNVAKSVFPNSTSLVSGNPQTIKTRNLFLA